MDMRALDRDLLSAHAVGDTPALVRFYRQAGETCLEDGNVDAGCFYLTHAYIFALETGAQASVELHEILMAYGREE